LKKELFKKNKTFEKKTGQLFFVAPIIRNLMKSERLKKFESELTDLEQWLNLGLVPKKELEKHKQEIEQLKGKIEEEKERLAFLKESGETEEFVPPKRPAKQAYAEPQTMPDMNLGSDTEVTMDMETDTFDMETAAEEGGTTYKEEATVIEDLEEDPFSDKNRWKRGVLEDPDADIW
jgi:hypothetical protein